MRRHRLILACLLWTLAWPGLAQSGEKPSSFTTHYIDADRLDTLWLDAVNPEILKADDAAIFGEKHPGNISPPARFAVPSEVEILPETHGEWIDLENGRLWMLKVQAPGATDLNFGFGTFDLPQGATLHVFSPSDGYFLGPYGARDVRDHGELWTPMIPGEVGVVELFVPEDAAFEPRLELVHIGRGYRDVFDQGFDPVLKQGSCNIDVVCPEGDPWREEIRSIALYTIGGQLICSGTLVNNTREDRRPLFLTANHCLQGTSGASMIVFWNYQSPTCGQLGGGDLWRHHAPGATLLTSNAGNDMALLELDRAPDRDFNVYYAGWDSTSRPAARSVGIHHPSTDEKAISFNDDPLTSVESCTVSGDPETHWELVWERGTTEPGSSGSGLFDAFSQRLVGYLTGGSASCANPGGTDCYGKFSVGWTRGLKPVLDPGNTGLRTIPGMEGVECHPDSPLMDEVTVTYGPVPQTGKVDSTGFWVYYGLEGIALESRHIPYGGEVTCTYQFFGRDPVPGLDKKCYLNTNNGMIPTAYEGGVFHVPDGTVTQTYTRTDACSITRQCSNEEFGSDPAFNYFKQCTYDRPEDTVTIGGNQWYTLNWRQYSPMTGSIEGPSFLETNELGTWSIDVEGGKLPYTYQWQHNGQTVGSGQTLTRTFSTPGPQTLSLTVTDALSDTLFDLQWVQVIECTSGPCRP